MMELYLRDVREEDLELLFDWANDPVVRRAAFHTEPIPFHSHQIWFRNMMGNPDIYQYILCEKHTERPLAQIRFAVEGSEALISYSVSGECRGQGIGTRLIQLGQRKLTDTCPFVKKFVAQVKYENLPSAKIFEKCGYLEVEREEYKEFTLEIKKLLIRADGNETIGLGHIMRCLSIADEASLLGFSVKFVTADATLTSMIQERGYENLILGTDNRDMEGELPIFQKDIEESQRYMDTLCLVDSYQVTERYLRELSNLLPVAVMDDLFSMDYPVACVINYNIYGELLSQKKSNYPNRVDLTGVTYAPLREQFLTARNKMDEDAQNTGNIESSGNVRNAGNAEHAIEAKNTNILVLTGGSDSLHLGYKITKYLLEQSKKTFLCFHVVCGAMNPNKEELLALQKAYPNQVSVHVDVKDMAGLMSQMELAVSAAGSTVYELSTLGLPFVLYSFVENQKFIAKYSEEILHVVNAGDFSKESEEKVLETIYSEVKELLADSKKRKDLSNHLSQMVDGKGAERIAKKLRTLTKNK